MKQYKVAFQHIKCAEETANTYQEGYWVMIAKEVLIVTEHQ